MAVFDREQTDYIAARFYDYFDRKRGRKGLSIRDAATLIDYVAGPGIGTPDAKISDPSKIRVKGGGKLRPAEAEVQEIVEKITARVENYEAWDGVFDELIKILGGNKRLLRFIKIVFNKRLPVNESCKKLGVTEKTYFALRRDVLSKAAVIAVKYGLIEI